MSDAHKQLRALAEECAETAKEVSQSASAGDLAPTFERMAVEITAAAYRYRAEVEELRSDLNRKQREVDLLADELRYEERSLWCQVAAAVAGAANAVNKEVVVKWADHAVAEYRKRFPQNETERT